MSRVFAQKERIINATPDKVFALVSDYTVQRPRILTPNFQNYTVEKGGQGSGTVIHYVLEAAGRRRAYHMRVDEIVRGRILTERDSNSTLVTTWNVQPMRGGQKSKVRVTSEWEGGSGTKGFFERIFAPLGLRRIYGSMLESLVGLLNVSDEEVPAVQGKEYSPSQNTAAFLALFGAVVAVALAISLLQRKQAKNA
ncbi:SRPBCC family protein [Dictyobacter arantiisoli]|nr:SRPBCC family protein [Dictyobacter arantiisoli]